MTRIAETGSGNTASLRPKAKVVGKVTQDKLLGTELTPHTDGNFSADLTVPGGRIVKMPPRARNAAKDAALVDAMRPETVGSQRIVLDGSDQPTMALPRPKIKNKVFDPTKAGRAPRSKGGGNAAKAPKNGKGQSRKKGGGKRRK